MQPDRLKAHVQKHVEKGIDAVPEVEPGGSAEAADGVGRPPTLPVSNVAVNLCWSTLCVGVDMLVCCARFRLANCTCLEVRIR